MAKPDPNSPIEEEEEEEEEEEYEEVEEEIEEEVEEEVEEQVEEEEEPEEVAEEEEEPEEMDVGPEREEEEVEEVEEVEEEEEEEEEEEIEEVEEEEEPEEEEGGDEEEDAEDNIQKSESGGTEDLKSVSKSPERLKCNPAAITHNNEDATCANLPNLSAKVQVENNKETSVAIVTDVYLKGQDKHILSEVNECSKSPVNVKEVTALLEKKPFDGDKECEKGSYNNPQQIHLESGNTTCQQVQIDEVAEAMVTEGGSTIGKTDEILVKEISHLPLKTKLKIPEDSNMSINLTPQCRPRSSSPGAPVESTSKRSAIVCNFFARGWCIKGNSCRFLHQKEANKEDLPESSGKEHAFSGTGCRKEARRLRVTSQEGADSSNTESSSKFQLQTQKSFVEAYGDDSHGSPRIRYGCNRPAGEDIPQGGRIIRDEYKSSFEEPHQFGSMLKKELLNGLPFSKVSSLTMSTSFPEHRFYSGWSSTSSSLNPSNNIFSHDGRTEDFTARNHESSFPFRDTYSSYRLSGSFKSNLNSFPSPHTFTQEGASSTRDIYEAYDFDRGYQTSRSFSLLQSSSPFFLRDIQASLMRKTEYQEYSWEPSVRFRPTFHVDPVTLTFSRSQYDPLLDSIEPPTAGKFTSQPYERNFNPNLPSLSTNGDPLLYGNHMPGESSSANDGEVGSRLKTEGERNGVTEESKESRAMKLFRAALIDYVKDLVKPFWKGGQLTKDAHKVVVKKAVEKVVNSLQPQQVPNTAESIDEFLALSRTKLSKLVESYVEKYANNKQPVFI